MSVATIQDLPISPHFLEDTSRTDESYWNILGADYIKQLIANKYRNTGFANDLNLPAEVGTSLFENLYKSEKLIPSRTDGFGVALLIKYLFKFPLALADAHTVNKIIDLNSYSPNPSEYAYLDREFAYQEIRSILQTATTEKYEDGIEPEFVQLLFHTIYRKGHVGLLALVDVLFSSDFEPEIICDVLRWLPKKSTKQNYNNVLWILKYGLTNPSTWIRYGAALGLASMKDKRAIPYIKEAVAKETVPDLKQDLEYILSRLEGK